jgi:hypothetical protein
MVFTYNVVYCTTEDITLDFTADTVYINVPEQSDAINITMPLIQNDGQSYLLIRYDNNDTPVFVYAANGNTIESSPLQNISSAVSYQYASVGTDWMNITSGNINY